MQGLDQCNILIILQIILQPRKLHSLNSLYLLLYLIHLDKQWPAALIQPIQVLNLLLTLKIKQLGEGMPLILPFLQPQPQLLTLHDIFILIIRQHVLPLREGIDDGWNVDEVGVDVIDVYHHFGAYLTVELEV